MSGFLQPPQRRRRFEDYFTEAPTVEASVGSYDVLSESFYDRAIALPPRLRLFMSDLIETQSARSGPLELSESGRFPRSNPARQPHDEPLRPQEGLFRSEYRFMSSRSASVSDSSPDARILSRIRSTSAMGSSRRSSMTAVAFDERRA